MQRCADRFLKHAELVGNKFAELSQNVSWMYMDPSLLLYQWVWHLSRGCAFRRLYKISTHQCNIPTFDSTIYKAREEGSIRMISSIH